MFVRHNTADELTGGLPSGVDDELEIVHERVYAVRAFRRGFDTLVLRGAVRDQKPAGLYIADDPEYDPEPLLAHEALTLAEALDAYTAGSAFINGRGKIAAELKKALAA